MTSSGQSNGSDGHTNDPYVDDLIEDALHYARFGRYSGLFEKSGLYPLVTKVVAEKPLSPHLVTELQEALAAASKEVPYETFAALKTGWSPASKASLRSRITTLCLVAASIFVMLITASLTQVHGNGVRLIQATTQYLEQNPEEQIDRLIREHYLTRQMLEQATKGRPGRISDAVSSDASFQSMVPLATIALQHRTIYNLTDEWNSLQTAVGNYLQNDAKYPIFGLKALDCAITAYAADLGTTLLPQPCHNMSTWFVGFFNASFKPAPVSPADTTQEDDTTIDGLPQFEEQDETACDKLLPDTQINTASSIVDWQRLVQVETEWLQCIGDFALPADEREQNLRDELNKLKQKVSQYALWVLPAIYGAMGAIMYHMRWVLHPLLPFPSLTRLVHRIVLSALAGVVLGWLYSSNASGLDGSGSVGFSLFILSFLFGFSLDAFFALLDRIVTMSRQTFAGRYETSLAVMQAEEAQAARANPPARSGDGAGS